MRTNALVIGMILLSVMCAPVMAGFVDKSWDFNSLGLHRLVDEDPSWSGTYGMSPLFVRQAGAAGNAIGPEVGDTVCGAVTTIADVEYGKEYTLQTSVYAHNPVSNADPAISLINTNSYDKGKMVANLGMADGRIKASAVNNSNAWVELFARFDATADTWYDVKIVYTAAADGSGTDTIQGAWKLSSGSTWTTGSAVNVTSDHRMNFSGNNYLFLTTRSWNDATLASYVDNVSMTAVPEPATMGLLTVGGLGVLFRRKRA
ncbi:MAG: PEP-CTERM sorting domain-containing protein [Phycisphaerae bacterium]|nr:PEP-CTERM sorting domain-containing protein [Phycisphaerae bacterium]